MFNKTSNKQRSAHVSARIGADMNFASQEAYNLLRTNLTFAFPDKHGGKVIGVTSSCPQEGKSTTSINLAYVLAEAGNKVILIDSDLRRPSVSKVLKMQMSPGLSNVLAGTEVKDAVRPCVLGENLDVLFSGDIPPNPSELVSSAKMKSVIADFAAEYDYVVIDMPPVNLVSDPIAMSKYIDGIVVVVRHGKTKKKEIFETVRQLKFVGARILGFVYNGFKRRSGYYTSGNPSSYPSASKDYSSSDNAAESKNAAPKDAKPTEKTEADK